MLKIHFQIKKNKTIKTECDIYEATSHKWLQDNRSICVKWDFLVSGSISQQTFGQFSRDLRLRVFIWEWRRHQ